MTVTLELADFVASAWLTAMICTFAVEAGGADAPTDGRSTGAVYNPAEVIVPTAASPPGTPLTFHETLVSLVLVTVAANACVFPRITAALAGVTATPIGEVGGGGGCATRPAPTPTQPTVHALAVRRTTKGNAASLAGPGVLVSRIVLPMCGKGRMPLGMQAKGQRKDFQSAVGETRKIRFCVSV